MTTLVRYNMSENSQKEGTCLTDSSEDQVVDRISATGEGPQSIAFPPGYGRGEHPRIESRK